MFTTSKFSAAALALTLMGGTALANHHGGHHGHKHGHVPAAVVDALNHYGFTSWDEIEFDDGHWEVDDAVHHSGKVYDLKLDQSTLQITDKEHEGKS